jgi:hypothetical protein
MIGYRFLWPVDKYTMKFGIWGRDLWASAGSRIPEHENAQEITEF